MVCWWRLHSFANFGLWVGLCDLQMCAMCVGFLNCPEGQKCVKKTKSSLKQSLFYIGLVFSQFLVLFLFFNLSGNVSVYPQPLLRLFYYICYSHLTSIPSFGNAPNRFSPAWLSCNKKMITITPPTTGINPNSMFQPLRPVSCKRLTVTARAGTMVPKA